LGEYSVSSNKHYSYKDERGMFQPAQILASGRSNGETGRFWPGFDPNKLGKNGVHWLKNLTVLDELTVLEPRPVSARIYSLSLPKT
jgi:hypothetical protein